MLKINDKAPLFKLENEDKNIINLENYIGNYIILFFYPKDYSLLCSKQCINFSKYKTYFDKYNTKIFGISSDTSESHKNFIDTNYLNITLLADINNKIRKLYKVPNIFLTQEQSGKYFF